MAFDDPFRRIADVAALSEANARQVVTRARRRLADEDHRTVDATEHRELLEAFISAAATGDRRTFERTLVAPPLGHAQAT